MSFVLPGNVPGCRRMLALLAVTALLPLLAGCGSSSKHTTKTVVSRPTKTATTATSTTATSTTGTSTTGTSTTGTSTSGTTPSTPTGTPVIPVINFSSDGKHYECTALLGERIAPLQHQISTLKARQKKIEGKLRGYENKLKAIERAYPSKVVPPDVYNEVQGLVADGKAAEAAGKKIVSQYNKLVKKYNGILKAGCEH